jgi:agmatinase
MKPQTPAQPFDADAPAEADAGIFGLHVTPEDAAIVLLAVPFDATTSYGHGAHRGPDAILEASHQVDLYDIELGRPYQAGIAMVAADEAIATSNHVARAHVLQRRALSAGDPRAQAHIDAVNAAGEQVYTWLKEQVQNYLDAGKMVGVVGGDHSVPLGAIEAHVRKYPNMGLLHIDAHADLRDAYEGFVHSHASIMHNVLSRTPLQKLVQVGLRDVGESEVHKIAGSNGRIEAVYDGDLAQAALSGQPFLAVAKDIVAKLPQEVYISLDIDGLDPVFCPNTGTPVPGGLSFRETCALMQQIVRSGRRIVGFDLMEVAPGAAGHWDANIGARLLYKMCGIAQWRP